MNRSMIAFAGLVFLAASSAASFAQGSPSSGPRVAQAIDETNLVELKGNVHPLARAEFDRGPVADSLPLEHLMLQLKRSPGQEQALQNRIAGLYNPHSPDYHKWLTAQEFGDSFGPSKRDISAVTKWLQSHGFKINVVYASGMVIDISGTAAQVRDAFHTEIHNYDVNGAKHIANAGEPQIPAALEPVVAGFTSLHDFMPHPAMHNAGPVTKDSKSGKWTPAKSSPNFSYSYFGNELYDVTPQDFATIYNLGPLRAASPPIAGKGLAIAVLEDSDMIPADWNTFRTAFGLSSFAGTLLQVHPAPPAKRFKNCSDPGLTGSESEVAIDAEWAGAVAPDAAIEVASCADTKTTFGGFIAAQNLINSTNPPPLISLSYIDCESDLGKAGNASFKAVWQQAAARGISVFVAAGDGGAAACDDFNTSAAATQGIAVNGFASTPYNVAVGGTDFQDAVDGTIGTYWSTVNGTSGQSVLSYVPEIPWNDSCASSVLFGYAGSSNGVDFCNSYQGQSFLNIVAASGGPSAVYSKPTWQAGVDGIPSDKTRDLPDVSLFAGNGLYTHALLYCMSDPAQNGVPCAYSNPIDTVFNSAGGTSFGSPPFAGIQALINQETGQSWGNPNVMLYQLAANEYGSNTDPNQDNLTGCDSSNGNAVEDSCVFYDVTLGDNDVPCTKKKNQNLRNCFRPSGLPFGVLSTSNKVPDVAYPTTTGWDFATGLGTVNVTNLVDAWIEAAPAADKDRLR